MSVMFILFVSDPARAAAFYRLVLGSAPVLDVEGMTEFALPGGARLGLMPMDGIRRLLPRLPVSPGSGAPRSELYLRVDDPGAALRTALEAGAGLLDGPAMRDWGDEVAYALDPDGHIVAFARSPGQQPRTRPTSFS